MLTLKKTLMMVKHHGYLETMILSIQWTIFLGQNNEKWILGKLLI
jgi:hypothetical protein